MNIQEQRPIIEAKLNSIEDSIELNDGHINKNRIPARNFIIFALAGGGEDAQSILKHKVHNLLSNPDACAFINVGKGCGEQSYMNMVDNIISAASKNHVNVSDLFHIYIVPVIYSADVDLAELNKFVDGTLEYLNTSGRSSVWQPFLMIQRSTREYSNIYKSVRAIEKFLVGAGKEISNRCCILSDQDSNGFTVHAEDLLQTVAMVVILQDSVSDNHSSTEGVVSRVRIASNNIDADKLFFTARNASISNPRRSVFFQRIICALEYFFGKTDPTTGNALRRMNFKFLNEIIKPYLLQLPHRGSAISFYPLYATMAGENFHERLEFNIKRFYSDLINNPEAVNAQIEKAVDEFLNNYFYNNGSLDELQNAIKNNTITSEFESHSMDCIEYIEFENLDDKNKKIEQFCVGEYAAARAFCEKEINSVSYKLMQKLASYLIDSNLCDAIAEVQEGIDLIVDAINEKLRLLQDVESVLVIGQKGENNNLSAAQNDWFVQQTMASHDLYEKYNKSFDAAIMRILKTEDFDCSTLLDVCYEAIQGSAESNYEFLKKVSDDCARDDSKANEFINTIKKNWGYTLRFMSYDESQDVTCVIGDPMNYLSRSIKDKFRATQFGFPGFDRIDVTRISAPFSPSEIWEWKQIEANGNEVTR